MKARALLSAAEVDALYGFIDQKLDGIGLETQPQVAARVLKLASDPKAGLRQYADVIKSDPALSGRLLRLANSAFFAQRQPVTNMERACVLLGLERLKAVSLGFYLSRAAAADPGHVLSRRVWGESVFRAALACELARDLVPGYAPEAFVIGLMLDVGVPLLYKLRGPSYGKLLEDQKTPTRQFREEYQTQQCTHVDVAAALMRRWRLPQILARPIERHHTAPVESVGGDPMAKLSRVAYYVGSLQLEASNRPREDAPSPLTAERVLGLRPDRLEEIVKRSSGEYSAMAELFRDTAETIGDVASVAEYVQCQLIEMLDATMARQFREETTDGPQRFAIGGHNVEVVVGGPNDAVAYLSDSAGKRLISHAFKPGKERAETVLEALGLEDASREDVMMFTEYLRSLAA
jgi:HD-like signal output (HDOD) protein